MAYIAALLDRGDKFRLALYDAPTVGAAMQKAFAGSPSPDAVLMVATGQRAPSAPQQEELFPLLLRRLAPVKLDGAWFKGSEELARRAMLNALENATAEFARSTKAQLDEWMKNQAARERAERERAERERTERQRREREEAEAARRHGFVYAFHYHNGGTTEWMKVGMTSRNDEAACWGRINDYIKSHNLPRDGWSFVGFVACREPLELEQRLHRRLRPFRIQRGAARELFRCSIPMYAAMLGQEGDFIIANEPGEMAVPTAPAPSQSQPWTMLQFLMGLIKGAVIIPLAILFGTLVLLAITGGAAGKGRGRRAGRMVEGAVGAFGIYQLWTWTFGRGSPAKFAGMAVGAVLSTLFIIGNYNATSDAAPGVTHVAEAAPAPIVTEAAPAPTVSHAPPASPTAVRPRLATPYFRPPRLGRWRSRQPSRMAGRGCRALTWRALPRVGKGLAAGARVRRSGCGRSAAMRIGTVWRAKVRSVTRASAQRGFPRRPLEVTADVASSWATHPEPRRCRCIFPTKK